MLAVGFGTPDASPAGESAGAAAAETSLGTAVWNRKLAPRHRRAVESFFGPQTKASPSEPK